MWRIWTSVALVAMAGCGHGGAQRCPQTSGPAAGAKQPANQPANQPDGDARSKAQVAAVLDDWHKAASEADEARYFGHFAPGAVFIGTDASERWDVPAFRAYAHPHFAKGKGWTYRATRRHVVVQRDVAWFDEQLHSDKYGAVRGSGVLRRVFGRGGLRWKIAHYVMSFPIPNDKAKAVLGVVRGGD